VDESKVGQELAAEFEGIFSRETVMECLRDTAEEWADAPVQTYVALLAERFARQRLRALQAA
jgi:arsenate reductase (thioredoxin)